MARDDTLFPDLGLQTVKKKKSERNPSQEKLFVHQLSSMAARISTPESQPTKSCIRCGQTGHRIADCMAFRRLNVDERWKVLRQKGLCRICLISHRPCRSRLEYVRKEESKVPSLSTLEKNFVQQRMHSAASSVLLRYLPVTLHFNGKSMNVFAYLDDGSSSAMVGSRRSGSAGRSKTWRTAPFRLDGRYYKDREIIPAHANPNGGLRRALFRKFIFDKAATMQLK